MCGRGSVVCREILRVKMPRTFPQPGDGKGPVEYDYDLFVIGGGSGGVRAARTAADFGAKVCLYATSASQTSVFVNSPSDRFSYDFTDPSLWIRWSGRHLRIAV